MENKDPRIRDDFLTYGFIKRNQHNRDIDGVKRRLDNLEARVGTDVAFAETFKQAQKSEKK